MSYGQIHFALWMIMIAYWVVKMRGNKQTIERQYRGRRLPVFILILVLVSVFNRTPGWPHQRIMPNNDIVQILGVVACGAGVALAIWARTILSTNWSGVPTIKEGHELITAGPYRYVRHPIYTGILLGLFGTLVLGGGRTGDLIIFALSVISLHFKSRVEEGFMLKTFPQTYPEYRRRTKAIIPFVW
jgi:protein-S-isoprenylcysteine O-methyltransferase